MNYIREAKEYLRNYKNLLISKENLEDELLRVKAQLEGYKEIDYSGLPGGGQLEADDKLCNLIFKKDVFTKSLEETTRALEDMKNIIDKSDEADKKVLMLSFVEEENEIIIMRTLNMSRATYYRAKGKAIRIFAVQLFGIQAVS